MDPTRKKSDIEGNNRGVTKCGTSKNIKIVFVYSHVYSTRIIFHNSSYKLLQSIIMQWFTWG